MHQIWAFGHSVEVGPDLSDLGLWVVGSFCSDSCFLYYSIFFLTSLTPFQDAEVRAKIVIK